MKKKTARRLLNDGFGIIEVMVITTAIFVVVTLIEIAAK